jgi:hypothetical protein
MSDSNLRDLQRNATPRVSNPADPAAGKSLPTSDPMAGVVAGCQQGNRQAQRLLYDHCHERLYRLIVRMVGHNDAADVLQQVFFAGVRQDRPVHRPRAV